MVKNLAANARDIRDAGSIPGSGRSPGGGNGNPFQYSCLGNPTDRGAWQATALGAAKSQTRLKQLSTHVLRQKGGSKDERDLLRLTNGKRDVPCVGLFHWGTWRTWDFWEEEEGAWSCAGPWSRLHVLRSCGGWAPGHLPGGEHRGADCICQCSTRNGHGTTAVGGEGVIGTE